MDRRHAFTLGAVIVFFCLIGMQAALVEQWLTMYKERDRQAQIRQDILRLERLVADIDNGFRGYVLMKQSKFLRPMVSAEASIPGIVQGLSEMTDSWPDLQGRVLVIQDRITELLDTKRRLTMEMTNGEEENVLNYIGTGEGLALAQTIAFAFQDLDQKIRQRQKEWDRDHNQAIRWFRWGFPVTAVGAVACGISLGRTTGRGRLSSYTLTTSDVTGESRSVRPCTLV